MPQIDLVTYGDTTFLSFVVFWVYFVSVVLFVTAISSARYFPSFFQLTAVSVLARFTARTC